jgi:hypothetical protein
VVSSAPRIGIEAMLGADGRQVMLRHCVEALPADR